MTKADNLFDALGRIDEELIPDLPDSMVEALPPEAADLPDSVYPHMFRRSRGTGLYRDGVPIEAIAVAMGHSSIQTTKDHYAFPSLEQKRKAMEIGNPVISSGNEVPEWPDDEDEFADVFSDNYRRIFC